MYFLYCHGFNGSPYSVPSRKLFAWLRRRIDAITIDAPQLGLDPCTVLTDLNTRLDQTDERKVVFGTSMGGMLAHMLMQHREDIDQVILLNPALGLEKILADFPRTHVSRVDGQPFYISDTKLEWLRAQIPCKATEQSRYLLLLQQDDASCDYRDALAALPEARADIQTGQGHRYENIETAFPVIADFLTSLHGE